MKMNSWCVTILPGKDSCQLVLEDSRGCKSHEVEGLQKMKHIRVNGDTEKQENILQTISTNNFSWNFHLKSFNFCCQFCQQIELIVTTTRKLSLKRLGNSESFPEFIDWHGRFIQGPLCQNPLSPSRYPQKLQKTLQITGEKGKITHWINCFGPRSYVRVAEKLHEQWFGS